MRRHAVLLVALALPCIAHAQSSDSYQCTMNGMIRRVEIAREGAGPVPCEVAYYKDSEAPGERQVLWNAANEAGYCEAQAQSFVARLEGFGWQCDAADEAAAAPAEESEDGGDSADSN